MLRKVIITLSFSLMFTSVTTVAKAEWIKDQQNKWVYYENNSSKLNYNVTENYIEPMKLPQYYQADDRWGAKRYGLSNMKLTGCVPTALAMAISGLKEDVSPVQVADFLYSTTMEMNTTFLGTSSLGVQEIVNQWGLNYKVIDSKEELEKTITNINEKYRLKGEYENTISYINEVEENIKRLKNELSDIDNYWATLFKIITS